MIAVLLSRFLIGGLLAWVAAIVIVIGALLRTGSHRPILPKGSVEEHFWVRDAIDRLRPQRLDWILTAALLVPGAGLAWMGLRHLFNLAPIVIGVASWAGRLFAAAGLAIRHRASSGLIRELEEREPPGLGTGSEHA